MGLVVLPTFPFMSISIFIIFRLSPVSKQGHKGPHLFRQMWSYMSLLRTTLWVKTHRVVLNTYMYKVIQHVIEEIESL